MIDHGTDGRTRKRKAGQPRQGLTSRRVAPPCRPSASLPCFPFFRGQFVFLSRSGFANGRKGGKGEIRFTADNTDITDQKMQNSKSGSLSCSAGTSVIERRSVVCRALQGDVVLSYLVLSVVSVKSGVKSAFERSRTIGRHGREFVSRRHVPLRLPSGNELVPYPHSQPLLPCDHAHRAFREDPPRDILGPKG
jgi:hypothetical protein